jgi:type IV pilus assembly protein PilN
VQHEKKKMFEGKSPFFFFLLNLNSEIDKTKKELSAFDKINKEIDGIKKDLEMLNNKIQVIKTLDLNREAPVRLLDALTEMIIPRRMWFTSLEEKKVKETPEEETADILVIKGLALDNKTVADFMTQLETGKIFSDVNLVTLQQEKKNDQLNLKSIEILCHKVPIKKDTKIEDTKTDKK